MIVRCPGCQAQYRLDPARLRRGHGRLRCARCQIVFPVGEDQAPAPSAAPEPRRLHVALLACEPGTSRQRLQAVAEALGVRVITSEDGPNALAMARRSRPRVVVASHFLAGLSGPEVLRALRDDPQFVETLSVLMGGPTPRLRHPAAPGAAWHGADGFIADDARDEDMRGVLAGLLGLPGGLLPHPDESAVRAHARVVAADLLLYHHVELEEGRRDGRLHPRVASYLTWARSGCIERFPTLRHQPQALSVWDDEVRLAIRRPAP